MDKSLNLCQSQLPHPEMRGGWTWPVTGSFLWENSRIRRLFRAEAKVSIKNRGSSGYGG